VATRAALGRDRLAELVSAAAYGTVLVLATLSVIGVSEVAHGHGAELVAGVGGGTWVAHLFAELLGGHVRHPEPLGRQEIVRAAADGSPVLASTVLPALVLLLGRVDVLADGTARATAMAVAVLQLVAVGAFVARVGTAPSTGSWIFPAATAVVGTAVVALTVLLGH
jgi:hypothetical protein